MNGHIKPIKLLNASKTPKRQQSNKRDKIQKLDISVPKAPTKNQQEASPQQKAQHSEMLPPIEQRQQNMT